MCYLQLCLSKNVFHHGCIVDLLEKCNATHAIKDVANAVCDKINEQTCRKILLSSERFLEIIVLNSKSFINFIQFLQDTLNVIVIYINRDSKSIVNSGLRHFLSIVNESNIKYYSNYFGFKLNKINNYFNVLDVNYCMLGWINKAYEKLRKIDVDLIEVKYNDNIIHEIFNSIDELKNAKFNQILTFNKIRINTFSNRKFEDYVRFCTNSYYSTSKVPFISYNQFQLM